MQRKKISLLFVSDLYAFSVTVHKGLLSKIERRFCYYDQSLLQTQNRTSVNLCLRRLGDDMLFSKNSCHYSLFRNKSLRFTGSDEELSREKKLLCDIDCMAGKRTEDVEVFSAVGTLLYGEESFYFAPAHSRAIKFNHSEYSYSTRTYAALINDTVLVIRVQNNGQAKVDMIEPTGKSTILCSLSSIDLNRRLYGNEHGIQIDLKLSQAPGVDLKSVFCANGKIIFHEKNIIRLENKFFLAV